MKTINKPKTDLDELLEAVDDSLVKQMQEIAKDVMPGNLQESKYRLNCGEWNGLNAARAVVKAVFNQWMREE